MKNLDTLFPFYDRLAEQTRFKSGMDYPPIINVSDTTIVPFIIRRLHNTGTNANIELYFVTSDDVHTYQVHGTDASIVITAGTYYDYISFNATALPAALPDHGQAYYLIVEDKTTAVKWYSETFGIRSSLTGYVKLTCSNDAALGNIMEKFIQYAYFDTSLIAPEYLREDTGDKRDGILVPEKQILVKADVLRFTKAPKYLVDALMLLPLYDDVTLTDDYGDEYTYLQVIAKDPEFTPESKGHLAKVEIQLLHGIYIKKLTYKPISSGGSTVATAIIKQSPSPVLTVQNGKYYEYYVLFDDDMPDIYYTPEANAMSTGEQVSRQWAECTNMTIHGFLIRTLVECEVRWTAIRVTA